MSADELRDLSQTSCNVLNDMGPQIQWVESQVTDDEIYCTYIAPNEEQGGFPAQHLRSTLYHRPDNRRSIERNLRR